VSSELKSCPFCGKQPEPIVDATRILGVWRIFHRGCPSLPNVVVEAHSRENVVAAWNRRSPSPAVLALVEACRELLAQVRGECPSLLNEDSGGDARLSIGIDEALAAVEREIGGA
jgi:Lar family restriction alleviation protein